MPDRRGRDDVLDTLRAELTKLRTLAGIRGMLAAIALTLVVVGAVLTATLDTERCTEGAGCAVDPVRTCLGGVWVAQIIVCVLGVVAVSSEYDPGQIGTTLAAMPRRLPVLAAKAAALVGLVAPAAAAGTAASLITGRVLLAGRVPSWSLTAGSTVRAAAGTAVYLLLVAVLSLGIALLVRDAAAAVMAVLGLLFVFPLLGLVLTDPAWQDRLQRWAPMSAGLAVQATRDLDQLAIGPAAGLAVFSGYGAVALGLGAARFVGSDA